VSVDPEATGERTPLRQIAALFLRLGLTGFGGPAAHVAMMEDEVVHRRRWLSPQRFLDLLGAASLIPGPNSTELAIHIGWARRGWKGLVVAGIAFIAPAFLSTAALAWAFVRYGSLPQAHWLLYGIRPVVVAIVVQAICRLAPRAARSPPLGALAAVAGLLAWSGVGELPLLLGAGLLGVLGAGLPARGTGERGLVRPWALLPMAAAAGLAGLGTRTLPAIFAVFLRIGSLIFGSGYVLLAFLQTELVERRGWLDQAQLVDAVAVGQLTPGPVFSTATFIGYLLCGPWGAVVATTGIFLPGFVLVALSGPLVPRLRASPRAAGFLDAVNAASLGLMAAVTARLAPSCVGDAPTAALALASALALVRFRLNSTWVVLGGAAAGLALGPLS